MKGKNRRERTLFMALIIAFLAFPVLTEAQVGHSLDAADGSPADAVYVDSNGHVGIGTTTPGAQLDIVTSTQNALSIKAVAGSEGVQGISGQIIAGGGAPNNYGVRFVVSGESSRGVYGGVNNKNSFGLYGEGLGDPDCWGVYGKTTGQRGGGIFGFADNAGDIENYGGKFVANGSKGRGVAGFATAQGTQENYGGYFFANGWYGRGVYGEAPNYHGHGGHFEATGTQGVGVFAKGGPRGYAAVFLGNVQVQSRETGQEIIQLGEGLDFAEGFDVANTAEIGPGSVLIIDPDNAGSLALSSKPYDKKVAGIVAGAKGLGSGVRLGSGKFDHTVALAGRVYCNVDASYGEIKPGDLLTTSPTLGYAMVVKDFSKAQGAIVGKAMESLLEGEKGQILVLVNLQ